MRRTTAFIVNVDYDDRCTTPDALGDALSRLIDTALSTPGILDNHGRVEVGEFEIPRSNVTTRSSRHKRPG
jgi:hypothetical protein